VLLLPHALQGLVVGERMFLRGVWVCGGVVVAGDVLVAFFSQLWLPVFAGFVDLWWRGFLFV